MKTDDLKKRHTIKMLMETDIPENPVDLFSAWMNDAAEAGLPEPNAMVLATSTFDGYPTARYVLLKKLTEEGFVFFTNYESRKSKEIVQNPNVALVFFWHDFDRQVRIEGKIKKISGEESDEYFESRPEKNKLGAWASPQSKTLPNRKYLDDLVSDFEEEFSGKEIKRPNNWGGYIVIPDKIEFWQGRPDRLHDRILYTYDNNKWKTERLAP